MQKKIDSIKIGVWIDETYQPQEGGGFSYYDKLIKYLDKYSFDPRIELVFITPGGAHKFQKGTVSIAKGNYRKELFYKAGTFFAHPKIQFRSKRYSFGSSIKQLEESGIEVIYYPIPFQNKIPGFPFIATSWDIGHRSTYPLPEFVKEGGFLIRENMYKGELPQALFVFTESEAGKKELITFLQIPEHRIKVVPLFAGDFETASIEAQAQYLNKLQVKKEQYFFYPAQFWAHKNHVALLRAFNELVSTHPHLKLVLSGSDKGNRTYISTLAAQFGIADKVIFPGFVSTSELYTLYTNATALVMPTFLGPTNMPLLEARSLGCPVICSAFEGHKEMLMDGALYFNPENYLELQQQMEVVLDQAKRNELIKKAHALHATSIFSIEHAVKRIEQYLLQVIPIRKLW